MTAWNDIFKNSSNMKLYILYTGDVHMNGNIHMHKKTPGFKNEPEDKRFNPAYCFLLEHPSEGLCLIDSGLHPDFAERKKGNFGALVGSLIHVKTRKGLDALTQISSLNKNPGDIRHILMTHLHPDHASSLPLFRDENRILHTDPSEYKAYSSAFGLMKGYLKKHSEGFALRHYAYNLAVPGFNKAADVFGDQSVLILPTPGHTSGHVSILLNMKSGPVLLTGDAAHRSRNLECHFPTNGDYENGLTSVKLLLELWEQYPGMKVIFSHDPEQKSKLLFPPKYYE